MIGGYQLAIRFKKCHELHGLTRINSCVDSDFTIVLFLIWLFCGRYCIRKLLILKI